MVDWTDYQEWIKSQNVPSPEITAHRRTQQVVVMNLERLLQGDEWGVYRAHVEVLMMEDDRALAAIREEIDQGLVGDALARAALRIQRLLGRLEARREDLALPGAILEQQRFQSEAERHPQSEKVDRVPAAMVEES